MTGPATNPKIRYVARFTPEAWIRDQATEVEPQDPQEWDCTTLALAHLAYLAAVAARRHESLDDGEGVLDNDDVFKDDPTPPSGSAPGPARSPSASAPNRWSRCTGRSK